MPTVIVRVRMSSFRKFNASLEILGLILIATAAGGVAKGQLSSAPPIRSYRSITIRVGFWGAVSQDETNGSGGKEQELIDFEAVQVIARACHVSDEKLASVRVVEEAGKGKLEIYQVEDSGKAYRALCGPLEAYFRGRSDGHTKEFMLAGMTNKAAGSAKLDKDLRALAKARPDLRVGMMRKISSGTYTNHAGRVASQSAAITSVHGAGQTNKTAAKHDEVCRWASYVLVDGEIGWNYEIQFTKSGKLENIFEEKRDAREYDPKYETLIQEVDDEVKAEMKKKGTFGKVGSVWAFWGLKKAKLEARGVQWRSPGELNPGVAFD